MKTTDLMIGDWVGVDMIDPLYNVSIEPHRVKRISDTKVTLLSEYVACGEYEIQACLCVPIPITDEILERNGFEKIDNRISEYAFVLSYEEDGEPDVLIRSFDFNESFVICTSTDNTALISIVYVHELQHALKLFGIDKEIIL